MNFSSPRLSQFKLNKLAIVVDEIRIQNKPCNLKVNGFRVFMFQYLQSKMKPPIVQAEFHG